MQYRYSCLACCIEFGIAEKEHVLLFDLEAIEKMLQIKE
jgi:hypothetical protein